MLKRFLLSFFAIGLVISGAALAQTLPPFITGTNTEMNRSVFEMGFPRIARNQTLTAFAGGGQASGTALNLGMNRFTTVATIGDSATLPVLVGGLQVVVINATANSMNIFPNVGGTINALAANGAYALAAGKAVTFFQAADGAWYANLSA